MATMATEPNPYAPPRDEREQASAGETAENDAVTCTVVLEPGDLSAALAHTSRRVRWMAAIVMFAMGLISGAVAAFPWQLGHALGFGALGWLLVTIVPRLSAHRSLANKTESERTVTYSISPDAVEVTTVILYQRIKWPGVHRFVEGPKTLSLYLSEALVQVIPKRALRSHDVDRLRAMCTKCVTPRKKLSMWWMLVFFGWLLLVVTYLAVWQFLQPDSPPEGPHVHSREPR
jgi:hypothetical protein